MSGAAFSPEPADPRDVRPHSDPDALVDAVLDGDLDEPSRWDALTRIRRDPAAAEALAGSRRVVSALRAAEPAAPDLTDRILRRLDESGRYLRPRQRRRVSLGRALVGAAALALLALAAVSQRLNPDLDRLAGREAPVSGLVDAGRTEAASGVRTIAVAVDSVRSRFSPDDAPSLDSLRATLVAGPRHAPRSLSWHLPVSDISSLQIVGMRRPDDAVLVFRGGSGAVSLAVQPPPGPDAVCPARRPRGFDPACAPRTIPAPWSSPAAAQVVFLPAPPDHARYACDLSQVESWLEGDRVCGDRPRR